MHEHHPKLQSNKQTWYVRAVVEVAALFSRPVGGNGTVTLDHGKPVYRGAVPLQKM
jgi:hypothetical protein